jgi:hypothetical protein
MPACRKVVYTVETTQPCSVLKTPLVPLSHPIIERVIMRDWRDRIPVTTPPVMRTAQPRRAQRGSATIITDASSDIRGVVLRTPKLNEMMMDALDRAGD